MAKYKKRADGRYATTVQNGWKENGKPNNISIYDKTIKELEEKRDRIRRELEMGTFISTKITFGDYVERWFETKKINISYHTIQMYISNLNHLKSLNHKYIKDIKKADVQNIINSYKDYPNTCEKLKVTLNQIFESAIDEGYIYKNPCRNVVLPRREKPVKRALTKEEYKLSDIAEFTDMEMAYIKMIKFCGLRREEALALDKSCFNFSTNTVTVKQALIVKNSNSVIKEPKSRSGYRTIPMPMECSTFMNYYINSIDTENLFVNERNKLVTNGRFFVMWKNIIKKMNEKAKELDMKEVNGLTSHTFRHNYATMLYYSDVRIKEAQYLLGHATISMTMDVYTHLETNHMEASKKFSKYIASMS